LKSRPHVSVQKQQSLNTGWQLPLSTDCINQESGPSDNSYLGHNDSAPLCCLSLGNAPALLLSTVTFAWQLKNCMFPCFMQKQIN